MFAKAYPCEKLQPPTPERNGSGEKVQPVDPKKKLGFETGLRSGSQEHEVGSFKTGGWQLVSHSDNVVYAPPEPEATGTQPLGVQIYQLAVGAILHLALHASNVAYQFAGIEPEIEPEGAGTHPSGPQ